MTNEVLNKTQLERFNRWYRIYPKKCAVGDGKKAWKSLDPDDALVDKMILAVEAQIRYKKEAGDHDIKYWKSPGPWIRQQCWDDEIGSHSALKEKAKSQLCAVEGCQEERFCPRGSLYCIHHHTFSVDGRVKSQDSVFQKVRQYYTEHKEVHDLRGRQAIKYIKYKLVEMAKEGKIVSSR